MRKNNIYLFLFILLTIFSVDYIINNSIDDSDIDKDIVVENEIVSELDISFVLEKLGNVGDDNRAGIEKTLHRISLIKNRVDKTIGLTSGASAPEKLVLDLINEIKKKFKVELKEVKVANEKVFFKLPKNLLI